MVDDLIYDIGMNNGDDTAYYLNLGYRVLAVEADPALVDKAKGRFAEELAADRLQILNVGIADKDGTAEFWICEANSVWNSFDRNYSSRDGLPHHSIEIKCRTFASILAEYGVPYFMKVDIEGNDRLCVDALDSGDLPKYLSVEADGAEVLQDLALLGYSEFKCISQFRYLPLEVPHSPETVVYLRWYWLLEFLNLFARAVDKVAGRKVFSNRIMPSHWQEGWFFKVGSSGPFGEGTPGSWKGLDEMTSVYSDYRQQFNNKMASPFWRKGKNYSFWADFHARRG